MIPVRALLVLVLLILLGGPGRLILNGAGGAFFGLLGFGASLGAFRLGGPGGGGGRRFVGGGGGGGRRLTLTLADLVLDRGGPPGGLGGRVPPLGGGGWDMVVTVDIVF